jgi:guanylate kinase
VPYTTRKPEKNERHGYDYFFIETETFENDVRTNKFLEYSKKDKEFYGTRRDTITHIVNSGKICLIELDTKSLKMALGNGLKIAYRIFISPPNFDLLKERLQLKYDKLNEEHINKMIVDSTKEIEMANHLNLYHYILENRDKDDFLRNISTIVKKLYPFVDGNTNNIINRRI